MINTKLHSGCYINTSLIVASWSEIYSDPKFDNTCYLAKVLFINSSTILTLAKFDSKEEADEFLEELNNKS